MSKCSLGNDVQICQIIKYVDFFPLNIKLNTHWSLIFSEQLSAPNRIGPMNILVVLRTMEIPFLSV